MKKNKLILTSIGALLACGMLTSCDYSNFSLFGFFYNKHIDKIEEEYKKPGSNNSSNQDSSSSSSEETTFAPQTYLTTSSKTLDSGDKIETYNLLVLLSNTKAALNKYEKYVPASGDSYTNSSFAAVVDYTRKDNLVTLSYGTMAYTDRSNTSNVEFYRGDDETTSKEAFKKAFDSDTASFVVNKDGTFALGTSSTGDLATGLSTANTYWYFDTTSRPSYFMLTLLDDSTYYLNSFCLDSKNDKMPVSAFVTSGTYKSYPDKKTDDYDVVRINIGRGHMYANNNGSNMEFDISDDDNFKQWLGMSVGNVRAYKVTKTGFDGLLGYVNPYGFEAFDKDFEEDEEKEKDPTDGAMLLLEGQKNAAIKLAFFNDGTYHFVWSQNKIDEQGTFSYDKDLDKLTLSCKTPNETTRTNESVLQEDGSYKIDYVSGVSEQLTQSFVISSEDFNSCFKVTKILSVTGSVSSKMTLEFNSDYSFSFAFAYSETTTASEKGSWAYDATKDKLTLKVDDKEVATSSVVNGNYDLYYVYSKNDQLNQHFIIDKGTWNNTFVHVLNKTLKGEKMGDNCTLTFNSNSTFDFSFKTTAGGTEYVVKETGDYEIDSSDIVTLKVGENTVATAEKQTNGSYKFAYTYSKSSQLTQDFVIDEHNYKDTFGIKDVVMTGVKSPEKTKLVLNRNHTYSFDYAFSGQWQSEVGGWSYDAENDKIVLVCKGTTNELTKQEDGTYKVNYIANISSQLTQEFILAKDSVKELGYEVVKIDKVNPSTTHFGFVFYSNHSYSFHFYNYNVTEYGTWSYDSSTYKFTFSCYNKNDNTAEKKEDGSYDFNYISYASSSMTQEFAFTAEDAQKVIAIA